MRKEISWAAYIEQGEYIRDVSVAQRAIHDAWTPTAGTRSPHDSLPEQYIIHEIAKI